MRIPLFAGMLLLLAAQDVQANADCGEVWLIHGLTAGYGTGQPAVDTLGPDRRWKRTDLESLLESLRPDVPLVVYAHGGPTLYGEAIHQVSLLRQQLARRACGRPFVLVGWLWPASSDRIRVCLMRQYGADAELQAWHLARVLQRVPPDVSVSLVGFSFGSRVVTGSLHLLAGGSLAGRSLSDTAVADRIPFRVTILAPAMNNGWLLPGRRYGMALGQMESLVIGRNQRDGAMRFYGLLQPGRGPRALGFTGPVGLSLLGPDRAKVSVVDFARTVSSHDVDQYLLAPAFRCLIAHQAFLEP